MLVENIFNTEIIVIDLLNYGKERKSGFVVLYDLIVGQRLFRFLMFDEFSDAFLNDYTYKLIMK